MSLETIEAKAFVPAKDIEVSKRFYVDLGFDLTWTGDDLAQFECGPSKFLLQHFYSAEHANNFMMSLLVADCDAWWQRVVDRKLVERYGVRAKPPEDQPWGMRDFPLTDPAGVLWRIGHDLPKR